MSGNSKTPNIIMSASKTIFSFSIIASVLAAFIIVATIFTIESKSRENINHLTQSVANGTALLLQNDLKSRMESLSQFAKLSQLKSNMIDEDWRVISEALYDTQAGYQAIALIDSDFILRKITPSNKNVLAQNFHLALNHPTLSAAIDARQQDRVTILLLDSIHDGAGIAIYVPIFKTSQTLDGFFSSLLLFNGYISSVLPSYLLVENQFTLSIDGDVLYTDQIKAVVDESNWSKDTTFELQGQIWKINIIPKDSFLNGSHYRMIQVLTLLGFLLCIFIFLVTYTSLTARKKALVIIDNRNKVDQLLKNLPGMAYQSFNKPNWPMITVSQGCEALTGCTKIEFETNSVLWGEIIHPEDYQRVCSVINKAVKENNLFELEYRILSKNDGVRLVWERGETIDSMLDDEKILEGFITDVTDFKRAEQELVRSHAFSEAIVNSVVEAVITIDDSGHIKNINKVAQTMFGYSVDEVKSQNVKVLMPNANAGKHDQYLDDYSKNHQSNIIVKGRELEAKRKDGSLFPIHLSVSKIQSDEEVLFVCLVRDITQQRSSEDQKRMHIEQIAHADRLNSLGEMAAGIAHEVNQPLTAISLFAQSGKSLSEKGQYERLPEIFEKLSQHSRRAGAVLERMQVMTKQGQRQREVIDCKVLIDEVAKLAEPDARMRDISIHVSSHHDNISVFVDRVQIQQVLLNLLRNGMQAMESVSLNNGNVIEIITKSLSEECIQISVVDSGCGLSSSMTDKLFSPFASTKKNGIGIGLSISKSIVEEHGGTIHYAKNTSAGSVFYFMLPIVD